MQRRTFLAWATHGMGALVGTLLGIPAVAYLLDARNRPAKPGSFKAVARLSELVVNLPTQVVIRDVRQDAWTLHPNDVIGRVWLIRRADDRVEAFTTICPHLGCSINFESTQKLFICPCHNGTFNLDGSLRTEAGFHNPAPRGMDSLECRRDPADPDLIQVKYENFIQGQHEKLPKV
jgi:menaquinol-cytochrome c reductase iron-sulfur subunit